MTDVRTWQQRVAAAERTPPVVVFLDQGTRAAVERWHRDRARARLLGVLVGRIATAPEPDDVDELARALMPLPWWDL